MIRISTGEIKKLLKECVANGRDCTPQDFAEYISRNSSKEFTKGQLAGAIAQLIESGDLIKVERGLYNTRTDGKEYENSVGQIYDDTPFVVEIRECLKEFKNNICQISQNIDVLNMSQSEFLLLSETKRINDDIILLLRKCGINNIDEKNCNENNEIN